MDVDVDAPLVRPAEVALTLNPDGTATLAYGGGTVSAEASLALSVLEAFRSPISLKDAFSRFKEEGPMPRFMAATSLMRDLAAAGILTLAGTAEDSRIPAAANTEHISALDDEVRIRSFLDAVAATVKPGDVVVDIGTGTGLYAMAAARAGASRVYALERGFALDVAAKVLHENGLASRITLIDSRTSDVPERADVIICDALGSDPFAGGILGLLHDAARRWAKPTATMIPGEITPVLTALNVPAGATRSWMLSSEHTSEWEAAYGFRFAALHEDAAAHVSTGSLTEEQILSWAVSDPISLEPLTLSPALAFADQAYTSTAVLLCEGAANAIALSFTAQLDKGTAISTTPGSAGLVTSWPSLVFAYTEPLDHVEDDITVRLTATSSGSVLTIG